MTVERAVDLLERQTCNCFDPQAPRRGRPLKRPPRVKVKCLRCELLELLRPERDRLREALVEAVEVIEDCWQQFAVDGRNGKWAGGLSTLEWVDEVLPRLRAAVATST